MKCIRTLCAVILVASTSIPFVGSAVAAPLAPGKLTASAVQVTEVGWRGRGWHHRSRHYGWRHRQQRYGWGPTGGGFVAGVALGSAIANSRAQAAENDGYCSQRFRSYDPQSGTYLGYDGMRHPCP